MATEYQNSGASRSQLTSGSARLACCVDSPGYGGSEIDLLRLLRLVPAEEVVIVRATDTCEALRAGIDRLGIASVISASRNHASSIAWGLIKAWLLTRRFPRAVFMVWAHHSDSNRWLQLFLAISGRRFVVIERLVPVDRESFRKSRLSIPIKKLVVKYAERVVVNGQSQVEHYRQLFDVPRGRIICIRGSRPVTMIRNRVREMGVDVQSLKARLGLPSTPVVICVGRLTEQKDQKSLLIAMSDGCSGLRSKAVLVLVGDGSNRQALELDAKALMPGRVIFAGHQLDPLPWLAAADLFVLPSRAEGLPGALIEAMAAGVPCIATNIPGNSELVQDGRTGFLVSVGRPAQLGRAIEQMLGDRAFASACACAAYELVRREYDESRESQEWRDLVGWLIEQA